MKPSLAIIPCKTDSKRVKLKNLQKINGTTMLEISILHAKNSKYIEDIFVSTESKDVEEIALKHNVKILKRPTHLLKDAEVCDVYVDALLKLEDEGYNIKKYEYLVALQPDHPDRDNEIDNLLEYAYENKYDDLFTVSSDIVRTGSVRILRISHVCEGKVSRRVGCFKDDATNIHSLEDLEYASLRISKS